MASYSNIVASDGEQNIAVAGTAQTLTLPAAFSSTGGSNAGRAVIRCYDAPVLFTDHGTAPTDSTASTGQMLYPGDMVYLSTLAEIRNFKVIRATASTGRVYVQYQRRVA